jgi:phosphoglycolate phosphatase-like HAD superfamily hydrolase
VKEVITNLLPNQCLWIGDTEVDIEAARTFGCQSWAVTCGLRNETYLSTFAPDFLSTDLTTIDLGCCNGN